ncbi:glycosyltransferase family 5 protein [Phycomyces blakesleeanus]
MSFAGDPINSNEHRKWTPLSIRLIIKTISSRNPLGFFQKRSWWQLLGLFIGFLGIVEIILVITGLTMLQKTQPDVRVALRQYKPISYKHLSTRLPPNLKPGTTVYHVTKEFGPATMGGMGQVLTAMASAQQRTGRLDVSVIMPMYSFVRSRNRVRRLVDLRVDITDTRGQTKPVEFSVYLMKYPVVPNATLESEVINVYLIGPGKLSPLNRAFRAKAPVEIYSSPKELPQEWKDQYFLKAVGQLISHLTTAYDEQPLFAPFGKAPQVDVVHLHGATNAYLTQYLQTLAENDHLGSLRPAVVYTMHDYLDELQYTNKVSNVQRFGQVDPAYVYGDQMFMASLAIEKADVVTFVSRSMVADMLEGRLDFYLKELVMDSLLRKAMQDRFFGISNGVDFTRLNPFDHPQLVREQLAFPPYARLLLKNAQPESSPLPWMLSNSPEDNASLAKDKVKQFLIEKGQLSPEDFTRPLVLFVGRFQYNKGLEIFEEAVRLFVEHDMKFAIIGQPNNYPLSWIKDLAKKNPEHVVLMSSASAQSKWLTYYRAAADFVFVPSLTESFGLVAVEGLSFGAAVISTGAGGLKEFLVDRPRQPGQSILVGQTSNAYLFEPSTLSDAIQDASVAYKEWQESQALREVHVLRMMQSALLLGWEQGDLKGPVYDYMRAYAIALAVRHTSLL